MSTENNGKRIAKNTILLYVRMLFLMLIGLYTSRVILDSLGVDDYGIYNVVGGVVSMFTMISGALSASISRFITFELGENNEEKLKRVFSSSVTIQIILSVIFVLLAETIGLWFVNEKLVIDPSRMTAANWVFQFSIITFVLSLISVPYNAEIVAHEKMSVFAYISIVDGVGKLLVALVITLTNRDRLIVYAFLIMLIALLVRLLYGIYCSRNFKECKYKFVFDKPLLKRMFSFAGWNVIGATSAVCRDHGGNIIINLFCGTAVNGARAIAIQVNAIIQGFVINFQTALNPQIIKSYASGDNDYMMKIVFQGARFSYYILFVIALPVFLNVDYLLALWLKEVPAHTSNFLRLVLLFSLMESLSGPLMTAMYATEKIRNYQIVVGFIQLVNLPLSYLFLYLGYPAEIVFVVAIILSFIALGARVVMLKPFVSISLSSFMSKVWINVMMVSVISCAFPLLSLYVLHQTFCQFLISSGLSVLCSCISILYLGCTRGEREVAYKYVKQTYEKINKAFRCNKYD